MKAIRAKRVCSIAGCDRAHLQHDLCQMHFSRWRRHGDPLVERRTWATPEERFWRHVAKTDDASCWEWQGAKAPGGYGVFHDGSRPEVCKGMVRAHRWSYFHHIGPIPDGYVVRHRCDNPPCVNPAHLSVGTHAENMRDMTVRRRTGHQRRSDALVEIGALLDDLNHYDPQAVGRFSFACRAIVADAIEGAAL